MTIRWDNKFPPKLDPVLIAHRNADGVITDITCAKCGKRAAATFVELLSFRGLCVCNDQFTDDYAGIAMMYDEMQKLYSKAGSIADAADLFGVEIVVDPLLVYKKKP